MNIRRFIPLVGAVLSAAPISLLALLAVSPALALDITRCGPLGHGNYVLTTDINATSAGDCLTIQFTASNVPTTIDLGGFTISILSGSGAAIRSLNNAAGTNVRNGTIVAPNGILLPRGQPSVIERVSVISTVINAVHPTTGTGISATGVVRDNVVVGGFSVGIAASGTVTGNYIGFRGAAPTTGLSIDSGSTVIGNTIGLSAPGGVVLGQIGLRVACPSNVINNTSTGSADNIVQTGEGCNTTNNVAP
jgi:hypothetical protein